MKKLCAWCDKDLNPSQYFSDADRAPITHGICIDCSKKWLAGSGIGKPLKTLLDQFPVPIFLVTPDVKIITANNAGISALGKKSEDFAGRLGGDVFNCKYAQLPEGCGNTIHCKSCAIRKTIEYTFASGKSQIKTPAYSDLHHITGDTQISYQITTEKAGEYVFLSIEDISETDSENKNR